MHPKNIHSSSYDFDLLQKHYPALASFIITTKGKLPTIDFANPKAVFALNKALLLTHYAIVDWSIPQGYLCPPIPSRVDYLHHIYDVIKNKEATGYDLGCGANCIYTLLGASIYQWRMIGVDSDKTAVTYARKNVALNPHLKERIRIEHQSNKSFMFTGVLKSDQYIDFTMCNPPFYASQQEADKANIEKNQNLNLGSSTRNFGGTPHELWCNGGEALFLKRMIKESVHFKDQVGVFSSLVSNSSHIEKQLKLIKKIGASPRIIKMVHGQKQSQLLLWKF